ncbi:hypothetical protein [Candidatus Southlakia epibionticum]
MQYSVFTKHHSLKDYLIMAASGVMLALAAHMSVWWLQLPALFAVAAVFVVLRRATARHAYFLGLTFCACWLLPTTYWYYQFMTPIVAVLASVGFIFLLANIWWIVLLRRWIGVKAVSVLFVIVWCSFTLIRLHAPVMKDWWIPHLGYTVWRNNGILMLGRWGGEAAIEFALLAIGVGLAWLWCRQKRMQFIIASGVVAVVVIAANIVVAKLPAQPILPTIAVQSMTEGGVNVPATKNDVKRLEQLSLQALKSRHAKPGVTIVWPENSLPASSREQLRDFTRNNHLRLVYHTQEIIGDRRYKKVVILDEDGKDALVNYKQHIAPDEEGVGRVSAQNVRFGGRTITAYVCYDLHYPDVVNRMKGSDTVYAPLDDVVYGYLQKQFHAADISLHAIQAQTTIVTASINGPTMAVNANGVIVDQLKSDGAGVLAVGW